MVSFRDTAALCMNFNKQEKQNANLEVIEDKTIALSVLCVVVLAIYDLTSQGRRCICRICIRSILRVDQSIQNV